MEIKTVKVNDIEMEYGTFGSGERAFVILPGAATQSVLLSSMTVEAAYRRFGEEYTVYLFDRRKNMPSPYPVRRMAADTAAVMRALGIKGADIFGASQGGMIAMCIAIDSPDLVRGLALGSTASYADDQIIERIGKWIACAKSGDMTALSEVMVNSLFSENTVRQYGDILMHMNDHLSKRDLERFFLQAEAINGFDVYDELDKITCPTLVIGVEGDKVLPCEHSKIIAEKLGCELYLYGSEYGHCAFDEAPDYKQRLLDFYHTI